METNNDSEKNLSLEKQLSLKESTNQEQEQEAKIVTYTKPNDIHLEPPNKESDSPKVKPEDQESAKETDVNQENQEVDQNIEKVEESTTDNHQEDYCNLESFFQDIDQFLSDLSSYKKEEKKETDVIVAVVEGEEEDSKKNVVQVVEGEEEDRKKNVVAVVEGEEGDSKKNVVAVVEGEEENSKKNDDDDKKGENNEKVLSVDIPANEKVLSVDIPAFVEKFLDNFAERIVEYETVDEEKGKWRQVVEDDLSFLRAVNQVGKLKNSLAEFITDPNNRTLVNHIGAIHQRAMSYLEDEFRVLLEGYRSNNAALLEQQQQEEQQGADRSTLPDSDDQTDDNVNECIVQDDNFLGYADDIVANLNRIANEMITGGYESECCQVYTITRRRAFDECLDRMGFEKISIDEVQKMQWEALENVIPAWIKTFKGCANIYFSKERDLAEAVFSDCPSISSCLFSNLVRGVIIQLLNFTEGIAMVKRSAEKLFKFLDMYETLHDSITAMDGLLPEECEIELKTELNMAKTRIGETAISLFCELENSIKSDTGKTPVPGGAVHPLTRYTMNYLKYACEYMATLEQVFKLHSKIERADSTSRSNFEGETTQGYNPNPPPENRSPFSVQMMAVMDLLDSNLEAKSKLYKEVGLGSIFMMNNGRYILQKIRGSAEIHQVVGDTWCRKKSSDLRNYHKSYQRDTWSKLLSCLGQEGLQVNGKVSKPVLKERFKNFNLMFDEIHRTQSTWVVSDEQLQSELRVSITAVVIPAYRSFLGRFSQYLDPGRQSEKYIKYQAEDIETCLDEFFDGRRR